MLPNAWYVEGNYAEKGVYWCFCRNWQNVSFSPWGLHSTHFICYSYRFHPLYHPSHTCTCPRTCIAEKSCCSCVKMHVTKTHMPELSVSVFNVCTVCINVFLQPWRKYIFPSWGVNEAPCSFIPITTKLHICSDGTGNRMWLPLNQWFADYYCSLWLF